MKIYWKGTSAHKSLCVGVEALTKCQWGKSEPGPAAAENRDLREVTGSERWKGKVV